MGNKVIKILSVDGGGIKGIIPSMVLQDMKKRLVRKGNREEFNQLFDVIAGTSTGGLIALYLAKPNYQGVDELVDLYKNKGNDIFPTYLPEWLMVIKQFFRPKYGVKCFERILEELFEDYTIKDATTNILISGFDMHSMTPYFFKRRPDIAGGYKDKNFYMKDVARATSAAPTYFPSANVKSIISEGMEYAFVDGGVFLNNPVLSAYIEARKIYPEAEKYIIVSLGTGYVNGSYKPSQVQKWGLLKWISPYEDIPILKATQKGQSISALHMIENLPNVEVYRLDISINKELASMDNTSEENIKALMKEADKLIKRNDIYIQKICNILSTS